MKLQAKFTLNFIFLVLVTIVVSFFLINRSVQSQFSRFIQEKTQEWQELTKDNHVLFMNPFTEQHTLIVYRETPEERFLHTVTNSLFWAGAIDILLAIILAYFLSKLLLQRIYKLKSAMHTYMKDGVSRPVDHTEADEIDDLAHIYNLLIEKIEKEEKVRKDFFVDTSHELRTPLTSIKGYLEGLVDHVFDREKEQDIHKKTLQETDRMIHLVKEMTSLAKLELEETQVSQETIELKDLTDQVVEMLSLQAKERELTIKIQGHAIAKVDKYKFKQVIINLLDNSIHYSKKGGEIFIEMELLKEKVYWKIRNRAQNVKNEDLEHFFDRFYRGDKSRNYDGKKPHLGIGLNIVKKIIEQHGGHVTAYIDGEDIVFEISLPVL